MQVLQGRMLFAKKEKVLVLGQVQLYGESSSQEGVAIKVNLTQLLQVKQCTISSSLSRVFIIYVSPKKFLCDFCYR